MTTLLKPCEGEIRVVVNFQDLIQTGEAENFHD